MLIKIKVILIIKPQITNLVPRRVSGITRYAQNRMIEMANNLKFVGSKNPKEHRQHSELMSPMHVDALVLLITTLFRNWIFQ